MPWSNDKIIMLVDAFLLPKGCEDQVAIKLQSLAKHFTNFILEHEELLFSEKQVESSLRFITYSSLWRENKKNI